MVAKHPVMFRNIPILLRVCVFQAVFILSGFMRLEWLRCNAGVVLCLWRAGEFFVVA